MPPSLSPLIPKSDAVIEGMDGFDLDDFSLLPINGIFRFASQLHPIARFDNRGHVKH